MRFLIGLWSAVFDCLCLLHYVTAPRHLWSPLVARWVLHQVSWRHVIDCQKPILCLELLRLWQVVEITFESTPSRWFCKKYISCDSRLFRKRQSGFNLDDFDWQSERRSEWKLLKWLATNPEQQLLSLSLWDTSVTGEAAIGTDNVSVTVLRGSRLKSRVKCYYRNDINLMQLQRRRLLLLSRKEEPLELVM